MVTTTVDITTRSHNWGWTSPGCNLIIYGNGNQILNTWLGAEHDISRTIDVSAYSTVRVYIISYEDSGEDGGHWTSVGIKNIYFHD